MKLHSMFLNGLFGSMLFAHSCMDVSQHKNHLRWHHGHYHSRYYREAVQEEIDSFE